MKCEVCGLEYGLSHNCPGPLSSVAQEIAAAELQVPSGAGLGYYLREALKIVRWDDAAIRRNAKDRRATVYGVIFWLVSIAAVMVGSIVPAILQGLPKAQPAALAVGIVVGLTFGMCALAAMTLIQLGLCHLIAKWFFGATGRYVEVMRPLLLGWFVNCLVLIPVAGMLLAGIGWTAVLMMVFEEVDEIGRLQAFGIAAVVNVCFGLLEIALMSPRHL